MIRSVDVLGQILRLSGPVAFKGKSRLINYWLRSRFHEDRRARSFGNGASVVCDLRIPYEAMVWLRQEEENDLKVLRQLLRKGDTFIDCGSNIGLWTFTAAVAVGPDGSVLAFEPNDVPRTKLEATLSRSQLRNVSVYPYAVGSENGTGHLAKNANHNVSCMVRTAGTGTQPVPVVTLDSMRPDGKVAGCKVDVEGTEYEVLQGAVRLIQRSRPWFCVEFNTLLDGNTRVGKWKVHTLLKDFGYVPFRTPALLHGRREQTVRDDDEFAGYVNIFYIPAPSVHSFFP